MGLATDDILKKWSWKPWPAHLELAGPLAEAAGLLWQAGYKKQGDAVKRAWLIHTAQPQVMVDGERAQFLLKELVANLGGLTAKYVDAISTPASEGDEG